ncbi:hypothetical protein HC028_25550 [Planosporangium flavigriseum]|uniref:DUF2231 domain-containing protein n=1 Tax=Planosporangium flavigriseum TaxID=373681 RepID=A0A8J3PPF7_9ACTN|nr:DUF2231 domain-containing protein [Planosporangium flavigriseum]NJC67844.1 hypothetical protein [Planosporangium flavigriseum]GIG76339.1 hypothetical protein Pfl04_47430 [Planosporangium flavigriseum]
MPEFVNGLPLHALVVHAVVVLLPIACLGVIAIALRSSWRARYGGLVVLVTTVATAAVPVATESGDNLVRRLGDPGEHAELGDTLLWFALPLLAAAVALYVLQRRVARADIPASPTAADRPRVGSSPLTLFVAGVAVVIAGANLVQVYRVGDSGARVVWQGVQNTPAQDR